MSRVDEISPPRSFPRSRSAGYGQNHGPGVSASAGSAQATQSLQPDVGARMARRRMAPRPNIQTVQEGQLMEESSMNAEYGSDCGPLARGHQRRFSVPVNPTSPMRAAQAARHGRSDSIPVELERSAHRGELPNGMANDAHARRQQGLNESYNGGGRPSVIRVESNGGSPGGGRNDATEGRLSPLSSGSYGVANRGPQTDHVHRVIELIDAVRNNHLERVNAILQDAPSRTALLNSIHPATGRTALHEAVIAGNLDGVALLLEWGADPDCRHSSQMPPIMYAVQTGNDRMVKLLLNNGADINAQDLKQYTALHYACAAGHRGIIKMLLVGGANMYARNRDGLLPQQLASTERIRTLFRKLHEYHEMHGLVNDEMQLAVGGNGAAASLPLESPSSPDRSGSDQGSMHGEFSSRGGVAHGPNFRSHAANGVSNNQHASLSTRGRGNRQNHSGGGLSYGDDAREADEEDTSPRELLESNESMFRRAWETDRDDDTPTFSRSHLAMSDVEGSSLSSARHIRNSRTLSTESAFSRRIVQTESMSDVEGGASRSSRRGLRVGRVGLSGNLEQSRFGDGGKDRSRNRGDVQAPVSALRNRQSEGEVSGSVSEAERTERPRVSFREELGRGAAAAAAAVAAAEGSLEKRQDAGLQARRTLSQERMSKVDVYSSWNGAAAEGRTGSFRNPKGEQLLASHRHSNSDENHLDSSRKLRDPGGYCESDSEVGVRRKKSLERTGLGPKSAMRSTASSESSSRVSNSRETGTDEESSGSQGSVSSAQKSRNLNPALRPRTSPQGKKAEGKPQGQSTELKVAVGGGGSNGAASRLGQKTTPRDRKSVKFDLLPDISRSKSEDDIRKGQVTIDLDEEGGEEEEEEPDGGKVEESAEEGKEKASESSPEGGASKEDLSLIRSDWREDAARGGCVACGKVECDCKVGASARAKAEKKKSEKARGGETRDKDGNKDKLSESPTGPARAVGTLKWTRGDLLGEGAYGKVFLGLNQNTGELMAVKQIKMSQGDEKAMHIAALEREIVLYRKMRHRHIVGYIDMEKDEESGSIYVFLEFVSGGSIHSMLEKFGKFSESLVRVYTRQLLLGLEYLHNCKIIHRDIKGGNVLVDRDGVIKLADFGASKAFHEGTLTDGCKSIRGSVFWMAPEVIKGDGYGRRADIWSVGCTVIEMLTGVHPWPQMDNTWSAIFHIAKTTTGPPVPEECSDEAKDFLNACFQIDPVERPAASELLLHPFVQVPDTPRDSRFSGFD